ASDNVSVTKVEFYDGTSLVGAAFTAPYTYDWAVSASGNGTHSWTAKAYDAAGNSTTSAIVSLIVNIAAQPPSDPISLPTPASSLPPPRPYRPQRPSLLPPPMSASPRSSSTMAYPWWAPPSPRPTPTPGPSPPLATARTPGPPRPTTPPATPPPPPSSASPS